MVRRPGRILLYGISLAVVASLSLALPGMKRAAAQSQAEITEIEVNQAIGKQLKDHLYFVAGKETVVRAFLSESVTMSKRTRLLGLEDSNVTAKNTTTGKSFTLQPLSYDKPTKVVDFVCSTLKDCDNWAAGGYQFTVTVKGTTKTTPQDRYVFKERKKLRILAMPIKANYNDKVVEYPDEGYKELYTYTRSVYPVAFDKIVFKLKGEFDASDSDYDINYVKGDDAPGKYALWQAMNNMNPAHCPPRGETPGDDCYDAIIGFLPQQPFDAVGFTYGKAASLVTGTDQDALATVSHEIAHFYDIGDTYKGGHINCRLNPAPPGWKGKNWYDDSKTTQCKKGPKPYETIGARIPTDDHPYEIGGRGALPDMACFMGSEGKQEQFWITPDVYDHLFEVFAPAAATVARAATTRRLIAYEGTITETDNTVTLGPWESYMDTAELPDTTGKFVVQAVDAAGAVLTTRAVKVDFYLNTDPPRHIETAPFQGSIRFPENTAKFRIVRTADGKILKELVVTPHSPTVTDVTPATPGVTISGEYTISWTGNDPDGGSLVYNVEYNPDVTNANSQWMILIADIEATQWKTNFDQLPGGANAQIRITASDGANTASGSSAVFNVPLKPPEVFIHKFIHGPNFEYGDEITFEADAYDLQEEWLPDANIEWTSDLSGVLGHGSVLIVGDLQPGVHQITVTAVNSWGLQAIAHTSVMVSACTYEVTPSDLVFKVEGGAQTVNVTAIQPLGAGPVCSLTDDDISIDTYDGGAWLTAKVASFADNAGKVQITLARNGAKYARTGIVNILGNDVGVSQKGAPCGLSLDPAALDFGKAGGNGAFLVDVIKGCTIKWRATKDRRWISFTSARTGTGDGTISFTVAPNNTGSPRTGHITVNAKRFTITQSAE